MLQLVILVIVFLVASGFLSMLDAALLSVSHAEVEALVNKRKWGSRALQIVTQRLTRAVIVLVIFTNAVNIIGPVIIGVWATEALGSHWLGVVTGVLAAATIVFSEIIPKSLGTHYAPTISRLSAPFILFFSKLLHPAVIFIEWILKPFKKGDRPVGTEEQIQALVQLGGRAGHIEEDERQLIQRAFRLNDRRASDIMIPRSRMITVPSTATVGDVALVTQSEPHTRYPVVGETLDDVWGFILSRDVLRAISAGKHGDPVGSLLQEVLFVSPKMRADSLLFLFRDRRVHLAIVRDEHRTLGLVTLKDVLEELVGDMADEEL